MAIYISRDGQVMKVPSRAWYHYLRVHHFRIWHKKPLTGHQKRDKVIREAISLVGIHEVPSGSNNGESVHRLQSSTGAYNAPWCVSTVQYIWKQALGSTWANNTAGAYFLEAFAREHKRTIPKPVPGCAVVYRMGDGHAGTVVKVYRDGTFDAVEGNWGDAVVRIHRNPRTIPCTFIMRQELMVVG